MENEYSRSQQRSGTWRENLAVSSAQNRNQKNLVFALASEIQQYLETDAAQIDPSTWDNINHWRAGILSQGKISDEDLSEIIEYIGTEKLQELIAMASSKTTS